MLRNRWLLTTAGAVTLLGILTCSEPFGVITSGRRPSFSTTTTTSPAPILLAAGDISDCVLQGDSLTAVKIQSMPDAAVVTLGDNVYPHGSATEYSNCYEPTWGQFKSRTHPALGNHEYDNGNADGSFGYYGVAAFNNNLKGYYSFNLGAWHIVVLNDNPNFVSFTSTSTQVKWLNADLAATAQPCILAIWHQPLYYSTASGSPGYLTARNVLWAALYRYHADVVLNGHRHFYERFALQDGNRTATPDGIREFIVGTGGDDTSPTPTVVSPNSQVRHGGTNQWGVLKLVLYDDSYAWEFLPVGTNTFTDRGSTACHDAISPGAGTLSIEAGNSQSASVGTAVAIPPAVKVTDAAGTPLAGVAVTFSVQAGGGSLTDADDPGITGQTTVTNTDADGIARVGAWVLGKAVGTNSLNAHSPGLNGSPLIFTASGTPGTVDGAASTAKVPNGTAGTSTTLTVQGRDTYGNAVTTGGAIVTVRVTGANTSSPTVTDNANGTYTAKYTPKKVGSDNVAITVNAVPTAGSPYTSTVVPKVVVSSGSGQTAPAGSTVPIPPSVKAVDAGGVAIPGTSITFTISSGGGTVSPTSPVITNSSGIAGVEYWRLGPTPGTNKLKATVTGTSSYVSITATGQ
jgi:hypothetical protein